MKKVALSMRGGGARCAAYIGVIKAFEEHKIPIDMIIGSSGGAIIGGSYAATLDIEKTLEHFKGFRYQDWIGWDSIRDFTFGSDDKALLYAKKLVGEMDIKDTKIKTWIQVTNINTLKNEIIGKGPLALTIIASSAVPSILRPIEIDGSFYVDGDFTSGYGADFLRSHKADIVIGLRPHRKVHCPTPNSLKDRFIRPIDASITSLQELAIRLNPVDYLMDDLGQMLGLTDFAKAEEAAEDGYQKTIEVIDEIKGLLE